MERDEFYRRCARILGMEYEASRLDGPSYSLRSQSWQPTSKNRWNQRSPGNGRYPGFGIIRVYGDRVHMSLYHPLAVNRFFDSHWEALDFLAAITS